MTHTNLFSSIRKTAYLSTRRTKHIFIKWKIKPSKKGQIRLLQFNLQSLNVQFVHGSVFTFESFHFFIIYKQDRHATLTAQSAVNVAWREPPRSVNSAERRQRCMAGGTSILGLWRPWLSIILSKVVAVFVDGLDHGLELLRAGPHANSLQELF